MTNTAKLEPIRGGRLTVPRSRGALSALLLILLGLWGALIPFFGPYFDFGLTPDSAWSFTEARGWFEVAPGGVTVIAGLLLLVSTNRVVALTVAWIAGACGAWFAVGPYVATQVGLGTLGVPISVGDVAGYEVIGLFTGVGVAIALVAAFAAGRISTRSVRDVRAAEKRRQAHEQDDKRAAESNDGRHDGSHERLPADGHPTPEGHATEPDGATADGAQRVDGHGVRDRLRHPRG